MRSFQSSTLPRAVLDEPDVWLDDDPISLVAELASLLEDCPARDNPTLDRIVVHRVPIEDSRITILEFTGPILPSEAHFVALIPLRMGGARDPYPPSLRYITLERSTGGRIESVFGTRVGEWSRRGHEDLGPGPRPLVDAFVRVVRALHPLDTSQTPA